MMVVASKAPARPEVTLLFMKAICDPKMVFSSPAHKSSFPRWSETSLLASSFAATLMPPLPRISLVTFVIYAVHTQEGKKEKTDLCIIYHLPLSIPTVHQCHPFPLKCQKTLTNHNIGSSPVFYGLFLSISKAELLSKGNFSNLSHLNVDFILQRCALSNVHFGKAEKCRENFYCCKRVVVQLFRHGVIVSATKNSFFGWNLRVM